ncbi:hypothetical protein GIV31_26765, partial [Pseudomonas syringae]|nr:hypothetical protein [Pseudomonas syringae]
MSTSTVSPAPGPVPTPAPGNNANTRFNQVLQSSNRNGATYRPASANEKAPALSDYASIEKPGTVAADTVRYVTEKGDHVLVSKSTSPELYQQVVDDQPALAGFKTSVAAGYKPAAADAEAPSGSGGYLRIGPPEEMGPGLIRYEAADGSKVIVSEQQNPELFKQVASDFKTLSGINSSQQEGYRLAGADEKVPEKLGDFAVVGPVDEAGPGLMRYV